MKEESLSDKIWFPKLYEEGRQVIHVEDVKSAVKKLKEEWKLKMRRMELINVEVSIYELNQLADKIFGSALV